MAPLDPQPPDWTRLPITRHWVVEGRFNAQLGADYRFSLSAPSERYTRVISQQDIWYWIV
jgi:hypothetical protein